MKHYTIHFPISAGLGIFIYSLLGHDVWLACTAAIGWEIICLVLLEVLCRRVDKLPPPIVSWESVMLLLVHQHNMGMADRSRVHRTVFLRILACVMLSFAVGSFTWLLLVAIATYMFTMIHHRFRDPIEATAFEKAMDAKFDAGEFGDALIDITNEIACWPNDAILYCYRGNAKLGLRDYRGAVGDYDTAISLFKKYYAAYVNRAKAKGFVHDIRGAIEDLTRAIDLKPSDPELHKIRGCWKAQLGDHSGAIEDLSTEINIQPLDGESYFVRGHLREFLGDDVGGKSDLQKAKGLGYNKFSALTGNPDLN